MTAETLREAADAMRADDDPFVADSVADWLDMTAEVIEQLGLGYPSRWGRTDHAALEVAHAYLGEDDA